MAIGTVTISDAFSCTCHPNMNEHSVTCAVSRSRCMCRSSCQHRDDVDLSFGHRVVTCSTKPGPIETNTANSAIFGVMVGSTACVCVPVPPWPLIPPVMYPTGAGKYVPRPTRLTSASAHLSAKLYSAQKFGAQYAWDKPLPNGNNRVSMAPIVPARHIG